MGAKPRHALETVVLLTAAVESFVAECMTCVYFFFLGCHRNRISLGSSSNASCCMLG